MFAEFSTELRKIVSRQESLETILKNIDDATQLRREQKDELKSFMSRTQNFNHLKPVDSVASSKLVSDDIWMDVTHTIDFPYTSGVQRVVRSIAAVLDKEPNVKFVRFAHELRAYRYLDQDEINHLLRLHRSVDSGSAARWSLKRFLITNVKKNLKKLLPEELYNLVIAGYRVILLNLRNRSKRQYLIPVPAGNIVIVPEVVGVPRRIEWMGMYSRAGLLRFVPIFYDIIPLKRPDLAVFGDDFAKYLEVFHFAEKVSCISESVREDLIKYLKLVDNEKLIAKTKCHLLGCEQEDFVAASSIAVPLDNRKSLLCVGTIEKRKNQLMIVRSLEHLKDLASQFKLVFVGNDGPAYVEFSKEIEKAKKMGFDVEVHLSVTEKLLKEAYSKCYATLFCSLEEGFGLPILESRSHGKVCLTSDKGSMKEIGLKTGSCLFAAPESTESIAMGIREIVTDGAKFKEAKLSLSQPLNWPTWQQYSRELLKFAREQ